MHKFLLINFVKRTKSHYFYHPRNIKNKNLPNNWGHNFQSAKLSRAAFPPQAHLQVNIANSTLLTGTEACVAISRGTDMIKW